MSSWRCGLTLSQCGAILFLTRNTHQELSNAAQDEFELEVLEALQDGRHVGYPRCETDGIGMLAEARLARAGVRLR